MKSAKLIFTSLVKPVAADDFPGIARLGIGDSIFNSLMIGCGETYIVALALGMGVSERLAGLLAVVPMVLGGLFQLLSGHFILPAYTARQWVVSCTVIQAFSLTLIALFGLVFFKEHGAFVVPTFFILATIYWGFCQATGPSWNSWIGTLVPQKERLSYFNQRNRIGQFTLLSALIFTGVVLKWAASIHKDLAVISGLLLFAGLARLCSSLCLVKHPDIGKLKSHKSEQNNVPFRKWIFGFPIGIILVFQFITNIGVHFSDPFLTPYLLKQLSLNYADYTLLTCSMLFSRALTAGLLTRLGRRFGVKVLAACGVIGIVPLSWLWGLSTSFSYLIGVQLIAGLIWGCHEVGLMLYLMEIIPHEARARLLSWCNVFNTAGMLTGCMGATTFVGSAALSIPVYREIFTISSLLRLLPLPVLAYWFRRMSPSRVTSEEVVVTAEGLLKA